MPQIGVFVELGGVRDVGDRKDDVLDCRTSGFEARADILADLLDLLLQIALADDTAGFVPGDLPAEWFEGTERESDGQRARRIGNFIAGMTDRFALIEHQRLFDSTPELR